jgi:hypothetical protein
MSLSPTTKGVTPHNTSRAGVRGPEQGFPPYYVDDGPMLPRAPFPMHSVLEKRDALDPSTRPLLVWECWFLTVLYVGWYLVGLPNLIWHLIRKGTIKTDDWFHILLVYVMFNLLWQFSDLFFVIRFHLRNRQRLRYGYEEVLGVRPDAMQQTQCPAATAVIVAYLPNEQGIIMQTLTEFVNMQYEGRLTVRRRRATLAHPLLSARPLPPTGHPCLHRSRC